MTRQPGLRPTPLRVALLLDAPRIPAWVGATIETLASSSAVHLIGWSAIEPTRPEQLGPLWRAYVRLDGWAFGGGPTSLRTTRVDPAVPAVTASRRLDDVLAALRAADLDVVVDLRSHDRPAVRSVARAGTWVIRHGSDGRPAGPIAYLADMAAGMPAAPTALVALADEPTHDRVVYRSVSSVSPISLGRTRDPACWKAARFPIRLLDAVPRHGSRFAQPRAEATGALFDERPAPMPGFVSFVARLSARLLGTGVRRLARPESWAVATRPRPSGAIPADLAGFVPIGAPAGHFYADPFVLRSAGRTYLFVEDWLPETRRGAISVLELDRGGRPIGAPKRIVERPYHLSYPFVFEHGGATYLLPETAENRTVELFRASAFPNDWEPLGPLLRDLRASDPTIVEHDGRLWLFAGVTMPGASPWDELWLWSSPTLDGPWVAHPANPIVSDARSARPAGRVFARDGLLYRPAQDCTPAYGRRIVINRIDVMTASDYRETPVATIEPCCLPGVSRTHCFDATDDIAVLDIRQTRWRRLRR